MHDEIPPHDVIERLGSLRSALVCDVVDGLGATPVFLGPEVVPLRAHMRLAGRVLTLRAEPVEERVDPPYQRLLASYEWMGEGTVPLVGASEAHDAGVWGELLSIAARARGAVGAVVDGLCRDVDEIAGLDFPVFARGASPLDSNGRAEVVEVGGTLSLPGGEVRDGDWVLGDGTGVVVFPADLGGEVVARAEEKDRGEGAVRSELAAGASIGAVFDRHGIL